MTSQEILAALRARDYRLPQHMGATPPTLASDLGPAMASLDNESRLLAVAVLARANGAGAGSLLLQLTAGDQQVAASAANALLSIKDLPPAHEILAAAAKKADPIVRGLLYLAMGRAGANDQLDGLRKLAVVEKDPDAAEDVQVAAAKLGGHPERLAFYQRVRNAQPDQAQRCCDQLLYVGDPKLAKALISWLSKDDGVMRLGGDRPPYRMIRMKDMAVWCAHQLGVKFNIQPEYRTNFDARVIQECFVALSALPEP